MDEIHNVWNALNIAGAGFVFLAFGASEAIFNWMQFTPGYRVGYSVALLLAGCFLCYLAFIQLTMNSPRDADQ